MDLECPAGPGADEVSAAEMARSGFFADSAESDNDGGEDGGDQNAAETLALLRRLEAMSDGDEDNDDQIVFDPSTGKIGVAPRGAVGPGSDSVCATRMAEDGFFADIDPSQTAGVLERLRLLAADKEQEDDEAEGEWSLASGGDEGEDRDDEDEGEEGDAGLGTDDDELVFDPTTGRLLVRPRGAPTSRPDQVSAVSMARSGFFASPRLSRLKVEQTILDKYLPGFHVGPGSARGTLTSNSGQPYSIRVDLPAFPSRMPEAFVTSPVLVMADGQRLSLAGGSHAMHVLGCDGDGHPRICHWHADSWTPSHTLYQVLIKVRIWLEAWEAHLRTGLPVDRWLPTV